MKKMILILLLASASFAEEMIEILPYKTNEFSPALNQEFKIPFKLKEDANVSIEIYTPDNNLIRVLSKDTLAIGEHHLVWDGKDTNKTIVPNEAYNIVIIAKNANGTDSIDARKTGGEIIKDLSTKVDKLGNINYILSNPARVQIRAGIANSSMLKVVSNWVPKNKGKVRQRWNMRDADNLVDVTELGFSISVSAFALPNYAILTTNNSNLDYFTYFKKNNMLCNEILKEVQVLKRGEDAISKHHYSCRIKDRDPRLFLTMSNAFKDDQNIAVLENGKSTLIKVSMHPDDEVILEKAKYEVSFFVDYEFKSEEELGYMPLSWKYTPNGLTKGEHILTVNVSSFTGQVGLKSYKFIIQ